MKPVKPEESKNNIEIVFSDAEGAQRAAGITETMLTVIYHFRCMLPFAGMPVHIVSPWMNEARKGGYEETAAVAREDDDKNVDAWIQSLKDEQNLAVINLSQNNSQQMWPLYELIDRSTSKGQHRYDALKNYMEGGQMFIDFQEGTSDDVQSDLIRIEFPQDWLSKADGKHSNIDGTLIREVLYDNKVVAWF